MIAYLDCYAGITTEMLLAALLDVGFSEGDMRRTIAMIPLQEPVEFSLTPVSEKGVHGRRLSLHMRSQSGQQRQQAVLTYTEGMALYQASTVPEAVREISQSIWSRLATTVADIQGIDRAAVRFPYIWGVKALVAITSAVAGLAVLEITDLYCSPLPLSSGSLWTASGPMSLPGPVTLELLRQVRAPWQPCSIAEELITAPIAALLAERARFTVPALLIERIGYGFGAATMPWPHCMRLILSSIPQTDRSNEMPVDVSSPFDLQASSVQPQYPEATAEIEIDQVAVIETHIDNMSGELLGALLDRLLAEGALDVSYIPMQMKKNRPATLVRVIGRREDEERLARLLLRESSTLGVRIQQAQRRKARRTFQQIETPLGPLTVKIKWLGLQMISAAPEYEDCLRLAREHNLPLVDVYEIAQRMIQADIIREETK